MVRRRRCSSEASSLPGEMSVALSFARITFYIHGCKHIHSYSMINWIFLGYY